MDLERALVPDGLWKIAAPLDTTIQAASARQGGGTAPISDRKVFCAIVCALTTSCAWRRLPPCFGVSPATAHRRFTAWKRAGLCRRLHNEVLDRLSTVGAIDWSAALVDSASVRAKREGSSWGPVRSTGVSPAPTGCGFQLLAERPRHRPSSPAAPERQSDRLPPQPPRVRTN
ncbi:transposase [Streptomyces anulatus]|uniref:transposase n=1 Tax=Streptomyces anulatus TaxID=1892 RepID=UPI0033ECB5A7